VETGVPGVKPPGRPAGDKGLAGLLWNLTAGSFQFVSDYSMCLSAGHGWLGHFFSSSASG